MRIYNGMMENNQESVMLDLEITSLDKVLAIECVSEITADKTDENIFYDLCFCLCAPQTTFESNRAVLQDLVDADFYRERISKKELIEIVKRVRFKNNKAKYLLEAKNIFPFILDIVHGDKDCIEKRNVLVDSVLGMGMKVASHFLRNQGCIDLAIIDTHILKFLEAPYPTTNRKYEELEREFKLASEQYGLTLAELDAYIWKKFSGVSWKDFKW